ncbi:MAG: hypothetical protein WCC59_07290 [Terriglobales bacterium]
MDLSRIIDELRAQRARLDQAISALEGSNSARRGRIAALQSAPKKRRRGHMTAAGRKRLSELLKKRWAQGKMGKKKKAA